MSSAADTKILSRGPDIWKYQGLCVDHLSWDVLPVPSSGFAAGDKYHNYFTWLRNLIIPGFLTVEQIRCHTCQWWSQWGGSGSIPQSITVIPWLHQNQIQPGNCMHQSRGLQVGLKKKYSKESGYNNGLWILKTGRIPVADPGFAVGGRGPRRGGVDYRGSYVSKILYVETKESRPFVGRACAGHAPLDPPMDSSCLWSKMLRDMILENVKHFERCHSVPSLM